jgi:hypothetical protein
MTNASNTTQPSETVVTLDAVMQIMQTWRNDKERLGQHIPDSVWQQIFRLPSDIYPPHVVRQVLGISKKQYETKYQQLLDHHADNAKPVSKAVSDFCEVTPAHEAIPPDEEAIPPTRRAIQQLKATHTPVDECLDPSTIVVEVFHPEGKRMKIHTTTLSFQSLLRAFFNSGSIPSC